MNQMKLNEAFWQKSTSIKMFCNFGALIDFWVLQNIFSHTENYCFGSLRCKRFIGAVRAAQIAVSYAISMNRMNTYVVMLCLWQKLCHVSTGYGAAMNLKNHQFIDVHREI